MSISVILPPNRTAEVSFDRTLSLEEFWDFCASNPDLVIERAADGKISIMSPVGFKSGNKEIRLGAYLTIWSIESGMGDTASSSTGFTLPDGAVKSPDAVWISDDRLAGFTDEELEKFPAIVPDFVAEIRSASDNLRPLQLKMSDVWMRQGVRLGWLVDPQRERVHIYRENGAIEIIEGFDHHLSGDPILPGFTFDLNLLR